MNATALALIPVAFVLLVAVLAFVWNLTGEVRELKTKVNTMWDAFIKFFGPQNTKEK